MAMIHLKNCAIVDGTSPERRPGHDVLIEGGIIREISSKRLKPKDACAIDVGGRTLMPGLIDTHVHVIAVDVNLSRLIDVPITLLAHKAGDILGGMLKRGFTSVRDAGGADAGLAQAVELDLIKGPRMFVAGRAISQTGGHGDMRAATATVESCACCQMGAEMGRIADGVPEVRRAARDELRKGAHQIKVMASGGVSSPTDPIWNLQYSEEEIRAIVEEARAWRTYVMAHAYTPESIARSITFGVRTIEHGNLIDAKTAKHVAKHDAFVVPTLATYEALERFGKELGLPAVSLAKLKDVKDAGVAALEILKKAGTKIGFGTDLLGAMHEHQSTEFLIRNRVLSNFEVLRSATTINADILQMSGKLGVVATGAIADLLVVDGDPLKDFACLQDQGAHLNLIMKDGKIYKNAL